MDEKLSDSKSIGTHVLGIGKKFENHPQEGLEAMIDLYELTE